MGNLSKREKALVIVGAILVVIYLYFSYFLSPIYGKIKEENNIIKNKKNQIATIEKFKISNIANNKKLESLKIKFSEGFKELPKNERNPEIARDLNIMAEKSKVTINSVTFGSGTTNASTNTTNSSSTAVDTRKTTAQSSNAKLIIVPVTLIINGDYPTMLRFTKNIEENDRFAQIVSINISSKTDARNVLQSNIVLNYYFTEDITKQKPKYDFKDDKSGKNNLFN